MKLNKRIVPTILSVAALLILGSSAPAALVITTANQTGALPFTPSWTPSPNSLLLGLTPTTTFGNFTLDDTNRNVNSLTAGGSLTIRTDPGNTGPDPVGNTTTSSNYVTCGNRTANPAAGSLIVYTLPASSNGYDITNISTYSGWADNGRDAQAYTVLYATASNPTNFIYLTNVSYNPTVAGGTPTANRVILNDSLGGSIATNVVAVEFIFSTPSVENGWTGYGAITVEGTAATSVVSPVVTLSASTQTGANPFTPSWTLESPSLIAGMAPSSSPGNFTLESSGGTNVLTDGVIGTSGTVGTFATCGANGGTSLIYTLTNVVNGTDLTNIVVYSGWADGGRDGQYYKLSYSTIAAPTTYIPITTVFYNPVGTSGAVANRVAISMTDGSALASGAANVKFDFVGPNFSSQFDNAYQGVSEIVVQGNDTAAPPPPPSPRLVQDSLPAYTETVVGDQVIFSAIFSNSPPVSLQWQRVFSGPASTNNINSGVLNETNGGYVTSTLTLNNVQLTDYANYRLMASNATNGSAAPAFSTAAPLVVSNAPAAVNNVILKYAAQSGLGGSSFALSTNFYPSWTPDTNNDLILGFVTDGSGNPGTATAGSGNFGLFQANADPTILVDGSIGYISYWPNIGSSTSLVTCGTSAAGPGTSMTYFLFTNSAPNGLDLTNITIYGGWGDSGRNEQKYQILFSTVANPSSFNSLGTFDYNPNNPGNAQSATRVTLLPASGALAQNVFAVQINWGLQGSPPKNGYEGYSEVMIKGAPSAPKPVLTQDITPLTADDVVGSSLTLTAAFSGATSYQWQKNGANIPGANSPTLALSNLQLSDTATNGGYRLAASNSTGASLTRECAVTVKPVPSAVGNVIIEFAHQTSDAGTFSPTWDTSMFASSLISGASPTSSGTGNFNDPDPNPISLNQAGGLPVLTDGDYGTIVTGGPHPAFATCGPNAGQFVTYTLPAATYGYDITNIVIASGWNDGGRDADWATIYYSTIADPGTFLPLAVVTNVTGATGPSVTRGTLLPATGKLAVNVYAIYVDFTTPPGIPNAYSGFSQINVFGSPATSNELPWITITENQNTDTPSWVIESPNLIAGQLPSSVGPGSYAGGFNNEPVTEGLPALTDGTFGPSGMGPTNFATCGGAFGAGQSVTYTAPSGWNITNIVVYSGWVNYDRDGQFYNISYSTLSAPTTFNLLASINYNPPAGTGPSANRLAIVPANGNAFLATNVYAVTFDFTPQTGSLDNGYSGYAEIVLQGSNLSAPTPPVLASPVLQNGNMVITGSGGTPHAGYTLVTTTNLPIPLTNWTAYTNGFLDGAGSFTNVIPVIISQPASFYRLRMP